jgi:tetratricopeptide (TPR) repeat protein
LRDIFAVQDEIAASVTLALGLAVSEDLLKSIRVDPEAYKQMLRSRFLIYRGAAGDVETALEAAKAAVAMAPEYAEAWSQLSQGYSYMGFHGKWPRETAAKLAFEAIETALTIDPRSANAHSRMGQFIALSGGDLALAADHMNKALAIEPDNAVVLGGSELLALELGRLEQAMTLSQRYLVIDPLSPMSHAGMCRAYYYVGQFAKALDSCRKTLKLSPEHWVKHRLLPWSLLFAGELDSLEEAEREGFDVQVRDFTRMAILHTLGEEQRFDQEFAEYREKYENSEPHLVAYVYVMLGMTDEAFECLDRITSDSITPFFLHIEPRLKPLHDDPRWHQFVERLDRNPEKLDKIELNIPSGITPG